LEFLLDGFSPLDSPVDAARHGHAQGGTGFFFPALLFFAGFSRLTLARQEN
jgi:hypothetical protein